MQFIFGHHRNAVSATVGTMSTLLHQLGKSERWHLLLDGGCQMTRSELQCVIDCVCCCACQFASYFFALFSTGLSKKADRNSMGVHFFGPPCMY